MAPSEKSGFTSSSPESIPQGPMMSQESKQKQNQKTPKIPKQKNNTPQQQQKERK